MCNECDDLRARARARQLRDKVDEMLWNPAAPLAFIERMREHARFLRPVSASGFAHARVRAVQLCNDNKLECREAGGGAKGRGKNFRKKSSARGSSTSSKSAMRRFFLLLLLLLP